MQFTLFMETFQYWMEYNMYILNQHFSQLKWSAISNFHSARRNAFSVCFCQKQDVLKAE